MGINSVNSNQTTDHVTAGHEAKQGLLRMQQILGESNGASRRPTMNEMHQEGLNARQNQTDNVAHMADTANKADAGAVAARVTGSNSSSAKTVSAADRQNEADKGAVAARRSAGSTDSSISSPKESKNIDYAAVYKKHLQGQRRALENAPRTPENQAKHKELTDKIAAIDANTSGTASNNSNFASSRNPTSKGAARTTNPTDMKSEIETAIKQAEAQLKKEGDATSTTQDQLKRLHRELNHVNQLVSATTNTDIDVTA
jgi:hypothetical protein